MIGLPYFAGSGRWRAADWSFRLVIGSALLAILPPRTADAADVAIHDIVGEAILQQNVPTVLRTAARLSIDRRFDLLENWVLPNAHRRTLRTAIDFAPTVAVATFDATQSGQRTMPVANVVSPAIELVLVARQLQRLDELQRTASDWQPPTIDQRLAQAAFLVVVALALEDFDTANKHLEQVTNLAQQVSLPAAERGSEALAAWQAVRHPQTLEAASELLYVLYNQAQEGVAPRSERWHRQIYSLKQWVQSRLGTPENNTFLNPPAESAVSTWHPVSRETAVSRASGYPSALWDRRVGRVRHVTAHDHDYLYYRIPLTGDFTVDATLSTFGYRDIHLGYGSFWAGPSYELQWCVHGRFRDDLPSEPIQPQLDDPGEEMRVQLKVNNGRCITSVNGRIVHERSHLPYGDPWLSIHSPWYANGTVRNLSITGNPVVPTALNLAALSDLPGWLPYFEESIGGSDTDWQLQPNLGTPSPVLRGMRTSTAQTVAESLIRYHRPIAEDGMIEYEFYYDDDIEQAFDVHPAIGPVALLIQPQGVRFHRITDGRFDRSSADPANVFDIPEARRGPAVLPLAKSDWNQVQLRIVGDRMDVRLNSQLICAYSLPPHTQRTFGLFHYADRSEARVRNLIWRGSWPKIVPPTEKQELVEDEVYQLMADGAALPLQLERDFVAAPSLDGLNVYSGMIGERILPSAEGLQMIQPGGDGFVKTTIGPDLILEGDFQITAAFDQLKTQVAANGNCNVHLLVEVGDEKRTAARLFRKDQPTDKALSTAIFENVNNTRRYDFPAWFAETATSGQLRLQRRGTQLYYLFAPLQTNAFRIIDTQPVGTEPTVERRIQLAVETEQQGFTSAIWKSLRVRAERIRSPVVAATTVEILDRDAAAYDEQLAFDFTQQPAPSEIFRPIRSVKLDSSTLKGLPIRTVGENGWVADGLEIIKPLVSDFDISFEFDVVRMEPATNGNETMLMIQADFVSVNHPVHELKYTLNRTGDREVHVQSQIRDNDGRTQWRKRGEQSVTTVAALRMARRGPSLFVLYRPAADEDWKFVDEAAGLHVDAEAIRTNGLRFVLHTGGQGQVAEVRVTRCRLAIPSPRADENFK